MWVRAKHILKSWHIQIWETYGRMWTQQNTIWKIRRVHCPLLPKLEVNSQYSGDKTSKVFSLDTRKNVKQLGSVMCNKKGCFKLNLIKLVHISRLLYRMLIPVPGETTT